MFYENDFCTIKNKGDKYLFERKKKRREKNVLGDIVEELINKYSEGEMLFDYVDTLETFINNLDSEPGKSGASYDMLQDFINCIVSQHYMLGDYKKTFYCANFKNILVFNNEFYIFMGNQTLKENHGAQGVGIDDIGLGIVDFNLRNKCLITKQMLSILKLNEGYINPPEINRLIAEGDAEGDAEGGAEGDSVGDDFVSKHLFNYNLGIILFSFLFGKDLFKSDTNVSYETLIKNMQSINYTKAFYLIQRCLDDDPDMRALLYV